MNYINFIKDNLTNILLGIIIVLLLVLVSRNEPLNYYGVQRAMKNADSSVDHSYELNEIQATLEEVADDVSWIRIWQ